ncbi:MAG: tryptophan halogenase family protein [Terricaulis sp.]
MTVRDLPPEERAQWRDIFEHYVFGDRDAISAHIPPEARGVLGPIDAAQAQRMRTFCFTASIDKETPMPMNKPVRKVVIVGGGTGGWMAAAAMSKVLGKVLDITLIESSTIGTIGVGEATIPTLLTYNRLLSIDEQDFMRAVKGTFKLGIAFENWTQIGHRYIHPFGITGKDHWTAGFQHFWLRGLREGHTQPYSEYCLELMAAEANKFAHLPQQALNYAYHLDSAAYAIFLRAMAEQHGARRLDDKIVDVTLNSEDGFIESVTLASGAIVEGDLFIDCSGFRAILTEGALHTGYEDWTHLLPCDRAIAVQTETTTAPLPYTRSIAHDSGWQWRIPLQHRMGNGIVYSSRRTKPRSERLLSTVEGKTLTQPNHIKFRTGMRRKHWNRNCIAVGLADGFIEPLESTSIHLIQRTVTRLMRQFPHDGIWPSDVARVQRADRCRMAACARLYRLALSRHTAHRLALLAPVPRHGYSREPAPSPRPLRRDRPRVPQGRRIIRREFVGCTSMLGQGIAPRDYHPIADAMSPSETGRSLAPRPHQRRSPPSNNSPRTATMSPAIAAWKAAQRHRRLGFDGLPAKPA